MSDNAIRSTTQEFLDVYDIVNDMVLLKDGTAAVILQIGTMNFSLLAEQEQDAVIFTYGSLLNSLNYPIQINIQSQTKDATKYLRLLDEQITKASSDRKANLIKKYRDFVAALIKERNVLQKRFYITVPASPGEMGLISASGVLPGKTTFDITTVEKSILLEKAVNILEPRKDHLTSQFNRLGLYVRQLSTQEIIQNFYINYNPEAAEGQEISSSENYTTPLVRASFGGKYMQLNNQQGTQAQPQAPIQTQAPVQTPVQAQTATQINPVYPTPEEIISGNPEPVLEATPSPITNPVAVNPVTNPTINPVTASDPSINLTPMTEPVTKPTTESIQQTTQVVEPITQTTEAMIQETNVQEANIPTEMTSPAAPQVQELNPEINLSLDPSLINTNQAEPKVELPQIFADEDPAAATVAVAPQSVSTQQATLETNQQAAEQTPVSSSDFTEEIMPLQNKFDTNNQESAKAEV